jgi:hypothetical protein
MLLLEFMSVLVMAASAAYLARLSGARGMKLVLGLALALFGVKSVLALSEAVVFLPEKMGAAEMVGGLVYGLVLAGVLSVFVVGLGLRSVERPPPVAASGQMPSHEWAWKLALCGGAYVALYMTAGMLILPFVRQYYADSQVMSEAPLWFLPYQLVRGALFVVFVAPLLRSLRASRWEIAVAVGFFFSVVHGLSSLIAPNPYMAEAGWRLAHTIEIGWSNLVYGLLVGFLFSRGLGAASAVSAPATT